MVVCYHTSTFEWYLYFLYNHQSIGHGNRYQFGIPPHWTSQKLFISHHSIHWIKSCIRESIYYSEHDTLHTHNIPTMYKYNLFYCLTFDTLVWLYKCKHVLWIKITYAKLTIEKVDLFDNQYRVTSIDTLPSARLMSLGILLFSIQPMLQLVT